MELVANKQLKILFVDDNLFSQQMIIEFLKDADYIIETTTSGMDALIKLHLSNSYDLILLDVEMPGLSGYDVCKIIRADKKFSEIPIIFLTANTDAESIVKGFKAGAQDYIIKPFNAKELMVRVNTHIQLKHKTDIIKEMLSVVEKSKKDILDSIEYAQHIQNAMLPSMEMLDNAHIDYFISYKPKDIVSGDFYWFKRIKNVLYFAAADCTGHGVAGAFMSILGISMLNEMITKRDMNKPSDILEALRKKVKGALNQYANDQENNNGMDIALCSLDIETKSLQYSGAFSPFYLIRKKEGLETPVLETIPADRMPIGISPNDNQSFTNHEVQLLENDIIYLFSDGYASQFGGENNEKFKTRRFQELLIRVFKKPLLQQKIILEETLEEWRGKNEQVDDILVMGIQIK